MKTYRIMANRYGFIDIEAESESDALEQAEKLDESEFNWSDADDFQSVPIDN